VSHPRYGYHHGTPGAGPVAATMGNGIGIAGVSQARIMPLKFLGPVGGTTADAIRALDYALAMGAHVTNNSWGGISFSASLRSKIQQANSDGQLFVAAAGNDARDTDTIPHYPSSFDVANIISVAATTHADGLATFSNHGATSVDLGAPGTSILSTVPPFSKAVLRARTASTGAVGYHTFGLEGMATAGERATLLGAALDWMEVGADDPILVVDDDGGASFETHYQSALDTLGYEAVATTQQLGSPTGQQGVTQPCPSSTDGPSAATMSGYRAVVWLAGATWRCTLTPTDQANLATYVNAQTGAVDRNLLLFGQDIGFDLTRDGTQASTFMHGVLRADFVADQDLNFRVSPTPGSPYAGMPGFVLNGGVPAAASGGQWWSSAVAPRPGAVTGLLGADTAWFSGTSMAAPHVTGAVAVVTDWWRGRHGGVTPSPAMHKALLVNSATDIGLSPIPNGAEGWGRVNLGGLLDPTVERVYVDQEVVLTEVGQTYQVSVRPADPTRPFKVTLAWSDAPAAPNADPALVNDLDLVVTAADGAVYRGHVLAGGR
jgi:subtilisin family serine protease